MLNLFSRDVADIGAFLLGMDVIQVGGGNTANLLAVWRRRMRAAWCGGLPSGIACEDAAAVYFDNGQLAVAVSAVVGASACRVVREGEQAKEIPLVMFSLDRSGTPVRVFPVWIMRPCPVTLAVRTTPAPG